MLYPKSRGVQDSEKERRKSPKSPKTRENTSVKNLQKVRTETNVDLPILGPFTHEPASGILKFGSGKPCGTKSKQNLIFCHYFNKIRWQRGKSTDSAINQTGQGTRQMVKADRAPQDELYPDVSRHQRHEYSDNKQWGKATAGHRRKNREQQEQKGKTAKKAHCFGKIKNSSSAILDCARGSYRDTRLATDYTLKILKE